MNKDEEIKHQTVKVGEGSGFIVQPATEDYSYIFTARHNIQNDPDDFSKDVKNDSDIRILKISEDNEHGYSEVEILGKYYSKDPELDIAIIVIPHQSNITVYPQYDQIDQGTTFRLWGYPYYDEDKTAKLTNQINILELVLHRNDSSNLEFRNKSDASYGEIQGYSGGGIFSLSGGLIAIENKMSNAQAEHGHIKGISMVFYRELLEEQSLHQVYPKYLTNFSNYRDKTFEFNNCVDPRNLTKAKNRLQSVVQKYIDLGNCSPLKILDSLKEYLIVYKRKPAELESERLWIALLEIMVIKHFVDGKTSEKSWSTQDVKNLFNSIRFIFINSEKSWRRHIEEILCTNLNGLERNGIALLVLIGEDDSNDEPVLDNKIFINAEPDISQGLDGYPDLINLAESSPILTGKVKVVHLAKLHSKCLVSIEYDLKSLKSNEASALVTRNYSTYIPKMELHDD